MSDGVAYRTRWWSGTHDFPEQAGRPHHPGARPLGVAISAGGFRSFACGVGQLRALHSLGLMPRIGAISAVSGGAWCATAFAYAPWQIDESVLLGAHRPLDELTLDDLDDLPRNGLLFPITAFTTRATARRLYDVGVSLERIFGQTLTETVLSPHHIPTKAPWFALDALHRADLLARNPHLDPETVILPAPTRPFVITGTALVREPGRRQWYVPLELTPMYASLPPDIRFKRPIRFIEHNALFSPTVEWGRHRVGTIRLRPDGFNLSDLWGSTGNAPGGVMARLAGMFGFEKDSFDQRIGVWASSGRPYGDPLVDGGYYENMGLLPLLRRGFDRIVAFMNSNSTVGGSGGEMVNGVDGQIARLFGRPPSSGLWANQELRLFPPEELEAVTTGLKASAARGGAALAPRRAYALPVECPGPPPAPGADSVDVQRAERGVPRCVAGGHGAGAPGPPRGRADRVSAFLGGPDQHHRHLPDDHAAAPAAVSPVGSRRPRPSGRIVLARGRCTRRGVTISRAGRRPLSGSGW
ncbi:MAG: hypothetical protein AAFV53_18550 [Myxococcota bacterium]